MRNKRGISKLETNEMLHKYLYQQRQLEIHVLFASKENLLNQKRQKILGE